MFMYNFIHSIFTYDIFKHEFMIIYLLLDLIIHLVIDSVYKITTDIRNYDKLNCINECWVSTSIKSNALLLRYFTKKSNLLLLLFQKSNSLQLHLMVKVN